MISATLEVHKFEDLRDVRLRQGKQSSFIVAVPSDERNACNFPSLDKFHWVFL